MALQAAQCKKQQALGIQADDNYLVSGPATANIFRVYRVLFWCLTLLFI